VPAETLTLNSAMTENAYCFISSLDSPQFNQADIQNQLSCKCCDRLMDRCMYRMLGENR
jgi:hypothetical protein